MERALSAHLALFLIFVVVAAFTGILIYLGRLKRPTVLDVCQFLKPIDAETILNMKLNSAPYVQPTRWHYAELKESLLEIRRCFSALQFDLRLLIAWVSSQLHMELVEKPWEKDWAENPPSEAERLMEQQELEKFTAGHRRLLAEACALQKIYFLGTVTGLPMAHLPLPLVFTLPHTRRDQSYFHPETRPVPCQRRIATLISLVFKDGPSSRGFR
jgi:hypothetical protein